jgi:hypothetical protein
MVLKLGASMRMQTAGDNGNKMPCGIGCPLILAGTGCSVLCCQIVLLQNCCQGRVRCCCRHVRLAGRWKAALPSGRASCQLKRCFSSCRVGWATDAVAEPSLRDSWGTGGPAIHDRRVGAMEVTHMHACIATAPRGQLLKLQHLEVCRPPMHGRSSL